MNESGAKKSKFLKLTQQMACTQKICHEISMKNIVRHITQQPLQIYIQIYPQCGSLT